ncbi:MAG: hypothetical protein HUJ59_01470 [Bacilli bacterium]|nr:hypothetical protein [Bacilli bacterium]
MPKKPNNSNNDELQPYDPNTGEYKEKDYSKDMYNYNARKLGGSKSEFPLNFPNLEHHTSEYIFDYFNSLIVWRDVEIDSRKMNFLIDENSPKKRYLIFKDVLGFNKNSLSDLEAQIRSNVTRYKVFLTKKDDQYGFRVKIYMPIYSYDRKTYLFIKTIWILNENEKPRFVTAYYEKNYKGDSINEI